MTYTDEQRPRAIRHAWRGAAGSKCSRCDYAKSNPIHRLWGRCSVCWKRFKPASLDAARRCDACAP